MDGFLAVAGAQLDNTFDRRGFDDLTGARFKDRVLGAGKIIFRQLADRFEEFGAALVVKMVHFQPTGLIEQSREYRLGRRSFHVDIVAGPDTGLLAAPSRGLLCVEYRRR